MIFLSTVMDEEETKTDNSVELKIGPPGPNFPGKIGPTLEIMVRV